MKLKYALLVIGCAAALLAQNAEPKAAPDTERTSLLLQALEVASLDRNIKAFDPTLKRLSDEATAASFYLDSAKNSREQAIKLLSEKSAKLKDSIEALEKTKKCKLDEKFECIQDKK